MGAPFEYRIGPSHRRYGKEDRPFPHNGRTRENCCPGGRRAHTKELRDAMRRQLLEPGPIRCALLLRKATNGKEAGLKAYSVRRRPMTQPGAALQPQEP